MDIAEIQSFFFKAMVKGWAKGVEEISVANMPGYKAIPFQEGDFYLIDKYCVTPYSQKSAGTTTIWFKQNPVWVMNYGGFYDEDAIDCLKLALRQAYERQQFVGGRGPRIYVAKTLFYVNQPRFNSFTRFEGREEIFDRACGESLGFHEYWGMSLL